MEHQSSIGVEIVSRMGPPAPDCSYGPILRESGAADVHLSHIHSSSELLVGPLVKDDEMCMWDRGRQIGLGLAAETEKSGHPS